MKIYVASSWRNSFQPAVVAALRSEGHDVYDFRNPPSRSGFSWSSIDPNWKDWNVKQYKQALQHPLAIAGFESDMEGMKWADACVMVMPCGDSAHTEAGWFAGAGRPVCAYIPQMKEADLMYGMFQCITQHLDEVVHWCEKMHKTINELHACGERFDHLDKIISNPVINYEDYNTLQHALAVGPISGYDQKWKDRERGEPVPAHLCINPEKLEEFKKNWIEQISGMMDIELKSHPGHGEECKADSTTHTTILGHA